MKPRNRRIRIALGITARRAALLILGLWSSTTQSLRADVATCINLHVSAQRDAKAGRLRLASEQFGSCASSEACPDAIRVECVELRRDVEKSLPTVIFSVVDEHGKDITDVRVYSSDELLVQSLNGRAVALDPGKHEFKFVLPDGNVVSNDVLVREGEKNRLVTAKAKARSHQATDRSLVPGHQAPHEQATLESNAVEGSAPRADPLPVGFWISAGVGVAALASFGVFALLGRNEQSRLAACSPNCEPGKHADYDAMQRDYLLADMSLGIGIASAGAATWFLLARGPSDLATESRHATDLAPRVSAFPIAWRHGAGLVVNGCTF